MNKKFILVVASAILLGGCNINNVWQKEAAKDEKVGDTQTDSQITQDETKTEPAPSVGAESSIETLEADIEGTVIYDEDYSDLE